VSDPLNPSKRVTTPLSGHIAGVYARVDGQRGVHKAPANETILGVTGLAYHVTRAEQGELNQAGVNCVRFFEREGCRIWGARTLADAASEWRYVPVRRLFCMIEESIQRGTRWVVFEPNDEPLWTRLRASVEMFLIDLFRQGAFQGAKPEEGFFVKCDRSTMTQADIDAGRVNLLVGFAPLKPAEFVVLRFGLQARVS
jgi:phage tail sheath protein FI